MDVRIEVVAAEGTCLMTCPTLKTSEKVIVKVVVLVSTVTTSVLRSLTAFGRSSISAVAPDFSVNGGAAVGV